MEMLISSALAVIPALFLVWYYNRQDRRKPEPKGVITKIFLLGIVITFPVIVVEVLVEKLEGIVGWMPLGFAFFRAFVVAALCEEAFKLWVVKTFAYRNVNFDEIMDGVVYCVVASLGFACLENILYVSGGGIGVALLRAFTAVPMHALASGMMGYYIGKAKLAGNRQQERGYIWKGLWVAIFIHGLYDFLIFATPEVHDLLGLTIFPLLIVVFFKLRQKIKLAIAEDMQTEQQRTFAANAPNAQPPAAGGM